MQEDSTFGFGGRTLESVGVEEQKDRLGGRGSTGCDIDTDSRADVDGETGEDDKESATSIPPVKPRRDAFI